MPLLEAFSGLLDSLVFLWKGPVSVIFQFGQHSLDTETVELKAGSVAVDLEPQTFLLLQFLIENRDRVVSKDEIFEAVWEGRIVADSTLGFAVNAARRAVDDDGKAQAVIRTFPRRGFRFVAPVVEAQVEEVIDEAGTDNPLTPRQKARSSSDEPRDGTAATRPGAARRWRMPAIAAALVVIIAAGGLAGWQPWVTKVEVANPEKLAFPLPDKPSIAVLPFENLSSDAKQDYLSDGITENITTALSRVADMFVIPRTTTRTYNGKPVKVAQVAEELGVRYVLEGSVQRSGDQVRVTATLIDAIKGHQIWTERYDREVKDTFALQDDIALNVLTELEVKFTRGENARAMRGNTQSLEAYQQLARGLRLYRRFTKDGNAEARQLFEEAVESDPEYALAWYLLGWTHQVLAVRGWTDDPAQATALALELTHKALAIDPSGGAPYMLLADISAREGRYDEAITYSEKAVALLPSNAIAVAALGRILIFAGRPEEALAPMQIVKRFNPITPPNLSRTEGLAYHSLGRYDEAITALERARARNPKGVQPLAFLALTYADLGRMEEARAMAQKVLEVSPGFKVKGFVNILTFKDRTKTERVRATLLRLGLPE
ncbi:MAG: tetratricopeptide repeat protein [Alphaproteobacteria bacterium]|nr:tetratricopeptide repeat protein [Alphaproteobacteria bacterium]